MPVLAVISSKPREQSSCRPASHPIRPVASAIRCAARAARPLWRSASCCSSAARAPASGISSPAGSGRISTLALHAKPKMGASSTCAAREVFGFPFRIAMRCDAARLEVEGPAGKVALTAARLTGVAQIYDLNHVIVEATGPLSVEAPGVPDTEADWRSFLVSFVATGGVLDHADMAVEGPSLHMREGQNMLASQAERFELHVRRDPARPREDDAVELSGRLVRLASPWLDAFMGEASPADADVDASISKVAALQPRRPEASPLPIERWRLAEARSTSPRPISPRGASRQASRASSSSTRCTVSSAGSTPPSKARRPWCPGSACRPRPRVFSDERGKLRLPLVMSNGRMAIGPISVARLIPLYLRRRARAAAFPRPRRTNDRDRSRHCKSRGSARPKARLLGLRSRICEALPPKGRA